MPLDKIKHYIGSPKGRSTTVSIFLLSFLIIFVGIYLLSQRFWNDYEVSYNQRFDSAKEYINNAILSTSTDTNNKLNNIIKTQSDLAEAAKTYCETSPLIKWQNYSKIRDCEEKKEQFSRFLVYLSDLVNYLSAERELSTIITLAKTKTNENNQVDKWVEIEAFWRQASVNVAKLPDMDQFKAIKTLAINNLGKIADAWQALSGANLAKNRQQFEEAHINLDQTYSLLTEISISSKSQIKSLVNDVDINYKNIK